MLTLNCDSEKRVMRSDGLRYGKMYFLIKLEMCMKLNFKEKTFGFKLAIMLDRSLNVLTGGSFQECLSTRAYINAETAKPMYNRAWWVKVRNAINWMFWDGHCYDSFKWEIGIKKRWRDDHKGLLK